MKLFLTFDNSDYFYKYCIGKDYSFEQVFINRSYAFLCAHILKTGIQKVPRALWGNWKTKAKECEEIIISDGAYFPSLVRYIRNVNPSCRIVFYYMNAISSFYQDYLSVDNIRNHFGSENIYTYSYEDSMKYGFKWNPLHCYRLDKKEGNTVESDFLFLGRDKGRASELLQFYNQYKTTFKFNIKLVESNSELGVKSKVDYEDYIQEVYQTRALIEVVEKEVKSYTFRVVEAAIYNKKLITNNKALMELPIYQIIKPNTLVLDYTNTDKEDIERFLAAPLAKIHESDKANLGIDHWINSFL